MCSHIYGLQDHVKSWIKLTICKFDWIVICDFVYTLWLVPMDADAGYVISCTLFMLLAIFFSLYYPSYLQDHIMLVFKGLSVLVFVIAVKLFL